MSSIFSSEEYSTRSDSQERSQDSDENLMAWDQPRYIPLNLLGDEVESSCFNRTTKLFKLVVYVLMFAVVLGGTAFSQLSFVVIGAQMNLSDNNSPRIVWNLAAMVVLVIPKILLFLKCLLRRSHAKSPPTRLVVIVTTIELIGAVGDSLLIFRILPDTPSILVPLLFLALGWVPGILRSIIVNKMNSSYLRLIHRIVTPIATMIFLLFPLFIYLFIHSDTSRSPAYFILLALALFCSSIRWWSSFVYIIDDRPSDANLATNRLSEMWRESKTKFLLHCCHVITDWKTIKWSLSNIVKDLESCRYRLYTYISLMQIVIYFLLSNFLLPSPLSNSAAMWAYANAFSQIPSKLSVFWWVLINVLGALLSYIMGRTMCKVSMQRFSFALPLTLSSFAVVLFIYMCEVKMTVETDQTRAYIFNMEFSKFVVLQPWRKFVFWIFAIGLMICQAITGSHIFKPRQNKYNLGDSLFMAPFYEGACIVQSMIYGRKGFDECETVNETTREKQIPMIYMCATMWHESVDEMQQLFVSIFRTDAKQKVRETKGRKKRTYQPGQYNFEVHILFDDAFETKFNENTKQYERFVNKYVQGLATAINNAAKLVQKTKESTLGRPTRYITPYGGQLIWKTPGNRSIFVHLKDKTKVRNRKRWSQVMYLYYLLTKKTRLQMKPTKSDNTTDIDKPFLDLLTKDCFRQVQNTFILMLDGDIVWQPSAIQLLLNDLLKNEQTAAVCARVIPSGSGPIIWYQMIEYAIQHWLAKTMENSFGCVLCTPGCFSLFRASALLDDNVLKAYSKTPEKARELVQYDQGEDRWLCTLLLQCRTGYRVNYCAAASAVASSPTSFSEFLNQRRRWIPSSLINHFDFIRNGRTITKYNKNISLFYVILQAVLFMCNITAPAFIIIYMPSALTFNGISLTAAYVIVVIPVVIHMVVCLVCTKDVQIQVTGIFALFMSLFFVMAFATSIFAVVYQIENFAHYFIIVLAAANIFSGLLHPFEAHNLIFLPLYTAGTLVMFLLFFNYALCNINDMGWGTREGTGIKNGITRKNIIIRTKDALFRRWEDLIAPKKLLKDDDLKTALLLDYETQDLLVHSPTARTTYDNDSKDTAMRMKAHLDETAAKTEWEDKEELERRTKDPSIPWSSDDIQINCENDQEMYVLDAEDIQFWNEFIPKYITPVDLKDHEKEQTTQNLTKFRNQIVVGYAFITTLLAVAQYQVALVGERLQFQIYIRIGVGYVRVDYLTLCFLIIYLTQIIFQIAGMLYHRLGTLMEYLSVTELRTSKARTHHQTPRTTNDAHRKIDRNCSIDTQASTTIESDVVSSVDGQISDTDDNRNMVLCSVRQNYTGSDGDVRTVATNDQQNDVIYQARRGRAQSV